MRAGQRVTISPDTVDTLGLDTTTGTIVVTGPVIWVQPDDGTPPIGVDATQIGPRSDP